MVRKRQLKKKQNLSSTSIPEKWHYKLLPNEEIHERFQKIENERECLKYLLKFIYDAENLYEDYMYNQLDANEWKFFISCEGLPKANNIPDIRLFIEKLKTFEKDESESNVNWLMAVNENSILTQDIFKKDFTKKTLKKEISPHFGEEYSFYIGQILKLIDNIEYFLYDKRQTSDLAPEFLISLENEKMSLYSEILKFFDRYTYRILESDNANCNSLNQHTSEYVFKDNNFQIHIWMLKHVPIDFSELEELNMFADMYSIGVEIILPFNTLELDMTLRGIHYEFDQFSERAKSYDVEIKADATNVTAIISDLYECLIKEWDLYLNLQEEVYAEMVKSRQDYEQRLIVFEAEEVAALKKAKQKDQNKKEVKKKKVSKRPEEVAEIPEGMVPDVTDLFYQREYQLLRDFMESVYNPTNLKLKPDEINLKKYFILGGVYELYVVDKLQHIDNDFSHYNMTWHENNGHANINKDFVISHHSHFGPARSMTSILKRRSSRVSYRKSITEGISLRHSIFSHNAPNEVSDLEIKFKLPQYLCEFEPPIICQYEANCIEYVDEDPHSKLIPINLNNNEKVKKTTNTTMSFVSELSGRRSTRFTLSPRVSQSAKTVENFKLDKILEKSNIRNLEHYVLPRMLSSYKLVEEIAHEKYAEENKDVKISKMQRNKTDEEEKVIVKTHVLSHKDQTNPDRLFPIFADTERLNLKSIQEYTVGTVREPETFLDIISMLERLRTYLNHGYRKIMSVPSIKIRSPKMRRILAQLQDRKISVDVGRRATQSPHRFKKSSTGSLPSLSKVMEVNDSLLVTTKKFELKYSHWTTQYIKKAEFDKETSTMNIVTDRFGIFGFAFKRYLHFPFKYWRLSASEDNPDSEIIFTLVTQYVKCVIKITAQGFTGYVTEPTKGFVRNPKMYLVIDRPTMDVNDLKKMFREKNLNIFPDLDAGYYIEKRYFTEKHFATELHTFNCMAVHCGVIKFEYSNWNCLAPRRDILLKFVHNKETEDNTVTVRIKPEVTTFVEVKELCSENLDIINLEYTLTWRNLEHCSDLHQAVNSVYSTANDTRIKDFLLISNIRALLGQIRLLSYS